MMENFIINITQFFIRIIPSAQNIASSDLSFYPDTISHQATPITPAHGSN